MIESEIPMNSGNTSRDHYTPPSLAPFRGCTKKRYERCDVKIYAFDVCFECCIPIFQRRRHQGLVDFFQRLTWFRGNWIGVQCSRFSQYAYLGIVILFVNSASTEGCSFEIACTRCAILSGWVTSAAILILTLQNVTVYPMALPG